MKTLNNITISSNTQYLKNFLEQSMAEPETHVTYINGNTMTEKQINHRTAVLIDHLYDEIQPLGSDQKKVLIVSGVEKIPTECKEKINNLMKISRSSNITVLLSCKESETFAGCLLKINKTEPAELFWKIKSAVGAR